MRIQIDTDNKIIRLEKDILLKTLIDQLNKLFPNRTWENFTLETSIINNWIEPIKIYPNPVNPTYPIYPWCTYNEFKDSNTIDYNSGTYNVELK